MKFQCGSMVGRGHLFLIMGVFVLCYVFIGLRLVSLANIPDELEKVVYKMHDSLTVSRPDVIDRNGEVLITDITTSSLFANPRRMLNRSEAIDSLLQIFPDLDSNKLYRTLSRDKAFVFIKRELTPIQQARIYEQGIPGFGFLEESRRIYPTGNTASHILGVVNIDHEGLSGIERYIDQQASRDITLADATVPPIQLSLDLRVQHSLREELVQAMDTYGAIASAGIVLDVRTGEVIAASSLPDFDPNDAAEAFHPDRLNRVVSGVFEMGSTFKIFTTAMALDLGVASLQSRYDARDPIRVSSFTIRDFHAQHRVLSVSEIFIHSSNIGSAKIALDVGVSNHKKFLKRLGLLDTLNTELPESSPPLLPANWTELSTMTIAFGHGLSVTPLQLASAGAALVNGGRLITPTFLKRTRQQADQVSRVILHPKTSELMRYLMRRNVVEGTATQADAPGYMVGGKTGTAEKNVNGAYVEGKLLTNFIGAFPINNPCYLVWIMLDEPQALKETHGYATAGWNAAPVANRVIKRIAPMLSLQSREDVMPEKDLPRFVSFQ